MMLRLSFSAPSDTSYRTLCEVGCSHPSDLQAAGRCTGRRPLPLDDEPCGLGCPAAERQARGGGAEGKVRRGSIFAGGAGGSGTSRAWKNQDEAAEKSANPEP